MFEEVKDGKALSRIALHYNIFILTVIKADTLVSGYNCIYCTLVLKIELTLKFVKRSIHRSHCFCALR